MLFRNKEGELIEIRKSDYKNDLLYYQAIMNTIKYNNNSLSQSENKKEISQMDDIISKITKIYNKK
jgi:hypothetical protein